MHVTRRIITVFHAFTQRMEESRYYFYFCSAGCVLLENSVFLRMCKLYTHTHSHIPTCIYHVQIMCIMITESYSLRSTRCLLLGTIVYRCAVIVGPTGLCMYRRAFNDMALVRMRVLVSHVSEYISRAYDACILLRSHCATDTPVFYTCFRSIVLVNPGLCTYI